MSIASIAGVVGAVSCIVGAVVSLARWIKKISNKTDTLMDGMRCLLRTEMTRTYYKNDKTIRQYEYENFFDNYEAYKVLGGNSFIDKISKEIKDWEVKT